MVFIIEEELEVKKIIKLPDYWKDLVDVESISVQLQPIGAHQDVIVKRWDDEFHLSTSTRWNAC